MNLILRAAPLAVAVMSLSGQSPSAAIPAPAIDAARSPARSRQKAVVAGGCFWGIEELFQHVRGVSQAVSGYAGGAANTARYDAVSSGRTGHAESVEVTFDPSQVTYGQLLRVFFGAGHDPTLLNRQGPDVGTQYRSAIFFADAEQERIAAAYIAQLNAAKAFPRPIVTELRRLEGFYPAEDYHQDYASLHPDDAYIRINDAPKLVVLRRLFPDLWSPK